MEDDNRPRDGHAARSSTSLGSPPYQQGRPRARRIGAFDTVVMVGGLSLMLLAAQNVAPARAAAFAEGVPGTFVAREVTCVQHPGHESCSWLGDFRSEDGAIQRRAIAFYGSDRQMFTPGQSARAYDTGRQGHVYGPGGSNEWVAVLALLLFGLFMVARPLFRALRPPASGRAGNAPGEDVG
ncbi:hypothetical protein [Streptosporangium sp. H16]|uniref:hypothetical protein n=1 Tax=Streptosporangium sp. H16 TaxID=3444184 RepID=UPI003F793940